jgi:hypothetical protein
MSVEPGADPSSGALRFANWALLTVDCDTPGVSSQTRINGASVVLDLRFQGEGHPPEWCSVNAVWRGNPNIVRLRVPFPAKGVRTIAANGTHSRMAPCSPSAGYAAPEWWVFSGLEPTRRRCGLGFIAEITLIRSAKWSTRSRLLSVGVASRFAWSTT